MSVGRDTEKQHVTIHSNIHVNFGFIFRGQRHSQGESRGCKGEGFRHGGKQTYFGFLQHLISKYVLEYNQSNLILNHIHRFMFL